jgi:DNA-directed RNA polymerase specialized sigma24 family protein
MRFRTRYMEPREREFIQRIAANAASYDRQHGRKQRRPEISQREMVQLLETLLTIMADAKGVNFLPEAWDTGVARPNGLDADDDYDEPGGRLCWPAEEDAAKCLRLFGMFEQVARAGRHYFVELMRENEVSTARIAEAMGTTPQNVHRHYKQMFWRCRDALAELVRETPA